MNKLISLVILTALCVAVGGCGVKGPLYFPDKEPQQQEPQ